MSVTLPRLQRAAGDESFKQSDSNCPDLLSFILKHYIYYHDNINSCDRLRFCHFLFCLPIISQKFLPAHTLYHFRHRYEVD